MIYCPSSCATLIFLGSDDEFGSLHHKRGSKGEWEDAANSNDASERRVAKVISPPYNAEGDKAEPWEV